MRNTSRWQRILRFAGGAAAILLLTGLDAGPTFAICAPGSQPLPPPPSYNPGGAVTPGSREIPPPDETGAGAPTTGSGETEPGKPATPTTGGPVTPSVPSPNTPGGTTPGIGGKRRDRPASAARSEWSWKTWWTFNRWNYLPSRNEILARSFARFLTPTGSEGDPFAAWARRRDKIAAERVGPALLSMCRQDLPPGDLGIKAAASIALARVSTEPLAVEAVLRLAEDKEMSHEVRQAATFAAGLFRRTEAKRRLPGDTLAGLRARLFGLADDPKVPNEVRCLALISIGTLADQVSGEQLLGGMMELRGLWKRLLERDHGMDLHVAYLTAIGMHPENVVSEEILDGLTAIVLGKRFAGRSWNEWEQSHALCALVRLGGARLRTVLSRMFAQKGHSAHVRRAAFITLGERATDYDAEERKELARAWDGALRYARDPLTRGLAQITLGRVLAADFEGGDGGRLLITSKAGKTLLREARAAPLSTRGFAVLALAIAARSALSDDRDVERFRSDAEAAILRGLETESGNAESQGSYVVAAGLLGMEASLPTLEQLAANSNTDPDLRGFAAVACGQIGRAAPTTVRALMKAVGDYRLGFNRLEAALGLAFLTGDRDGKFLREDIERRRFLHSHKIGHVALALGRMGDLKSADPLTELLLDGKSDHGSRGAAAVALGLLCEPEDRPSQWRLWKDVNYPARTISLQLALAFY